MRTTVKERKGKRKERERKTPKRETTYVLRRAPSGYSSDVVCTLVPPLYFGSKNAATRPVVTRVSRGQSFPATSSLSFSFFLSSRSFLSLSLSLLFGSNERRLRAFALTAFQFVKIPVCPSLSPSLSLYRLYILSLSPFRFILDRRPLPSVRVHPLSDIDVAYRTSNHLPGCH